MSRGGGVHEENISGSNSLLDTGWKKRETKGWMKRGTKTDEKDKFY